MQFTQEFTIKAIYKDKRDKGIRFRELVLYVYMGGLLWNAVNNIKYHYIIFNATLLNKTVQHIKNNLNFKTKL